MRMQQQDDRDRSRVTGATLAEALRNVRRLHGPEARIIDSRHVYRRDETGLGRTRVVEVRIDSGSGSAAPAHAVVGAGNSSAARLTAAIAEEVERIEEMVGRLEGERAAAGEGRDVLVSDYPLADALAGAGAGADTIEKLAGLYAAAGEATGAAEHLKAQLRGSAGDWSDYAGCHLVLGEAGCGKTDLVMALAARLRGVGRKVLVLSMAPRHEGEVRRLQHEASRHGYDAAVMKEASQLERSLEYFDNYDAVLVDTPALGSETMADPRLRGFVAGNELIHRHLALPLDRDPADMGASLEALRDWNCDWAAVTRLDMTARPGKLADLACGLPTPLSLLLSGGWPDGELKIAAADEMAGLILPAAPGTIDSADAAEAS